jgi:hypothetical protein
MNRVLVLCIVGFLALVLGVVLMADDSDQAIAQGCQGVASCAGSASGCSGSAAGHAGSRGPLRGLFRGRAPIRRMLGGRLLRGCS